MTHRRSTKSIVLATSVMVATPAFAQSMLTGDKRLACEATLCLASPTQPSECNPALQRYYSIKKKKAKDTAKARADFLKLCPRS